MVQVWRCHHRSPKGREPDVFAVKTGVVGVGWQINDPYPGIPFEEVQQQVASQYETERKSWTAAFHALQEMEIGDLCYTRTKKDNCYYIGKVTGPWRYAMGEEFVTADVVNVRDCHWLKIGEETRVPGAVVASFRSPSSIQRISGVEVISKWIYYQLTGDCAYKVSPEDLSSREVLDVLSSSDLEDVIGIYLQVQGWVVVPSTCHRSTPKYEFYLIDRHTGKKAAVQVKSGDIALDPAKYKHDQEVHAVFLFTASGEYPESCTACGEYDESSGTRVECISPETICDFLWSNERVMPMRIRYWLDILRGRRGL